MAHQRCWISEVPSTNACHTPPPGATSFTYEAFGNRTSMTRDGVPTTSYSYDHANRLMSVSGADSAACAYNGDGLRMAKTVHSVTIGFVCDTLNAMPVILVENDIYYLYGPDGLPPARIEDDGTGDAVFYHLDHQGSVRALTDENGDLVGTYSYDPYGNPAGTTGTVEQPLRYSGQYLEAETGLYQLRARYYDPATGQFLTLDPLLAETAEPYFYAGNEPLNNADPLGLCSIGGIRIEFMSNDDEGCRGSGMLSQAASATRSGWNAGKQALVAFGRDWYDDFTDWSPRGIVGKLFGYSGGAVGGSACVLATGPNPACIAAMYVGKRAGKAVGQWMWDQSRAPNRWPPVRIPESLWSAETRSTMWYC